MKIIQTAVDKVGRLETTLLDFDTQSDVIRFVQASKNKKRGLFLEANDEPTLQFARKIGVSCYSTRLPKRGELLADYIAYESKFSPDPSLLLLLRTVHIDVNPAFTSLTNREKLVLQNHFRRVQQHCMVAAEFLRLQAHELHQDEVSWYRMGMLHDIDYSLAYTDMAKHGFLSRPILEKAGYSEELIHLIEYHNTDAFEHSTVLQEKAIFFSGRMLKQIVHAFRKYSPASVAKLTFYQYKHAYDWDFRRNEALTHHEVDHYPESFSIFREWMEKRTHGVTGYPLSEQKLFSLAKKSFARVGTFPANSSHMTDVLRLGLL